ncbi:MAG: SNF2-related protein [Promethearchaeia archaeon]
MTISNSTSNTYHCPFCGNDLPSRFSKCFNQYCKGQEFNLGNLVINRLNPQLGMGRVIKQLDIPASEQLDEPDTYEITKYKVSFGNNITKIIHPIDLIHYIFGVNEKVVTQYGVGVINSRDFMIQDGIISYEVLFSDGKKEQIQETEIKREYKPYLEEEITEKKPALPEKFIVKQLAHKFHAYYTSYQIKCITNSRLSLLPHQINVAHRLSEDYFPRVILADEVGLGKTIEAGIYIKEMMARNIVERALIIVPASLVKQWKFELKNKFNIKFTVYDGKKIKNLQKGHHSSSKIYQNPFYYDNLIICSLQFARNPKYIDLLSQISWDITVFDEAHHLRRYLVNKSTGNYRETLNYKLAKNISHNSESLLLLTATPLQLHSFELYSLIELIKPAAFENFSDFEHFRKNLPFINLLIKNLSKFGKLNTFESKNTLNLLKDLEYADKSVPRTEIIQKLSDDNWRKQLIQKIEDDHTLSKFLIRNRKKNVFSEDHLNKRIVKTITVEPTTEELNVYRAIRLYLAKIYNTSLKGGNNIGLGFVITTLQKMLTSSKHAILKSIERRLEKIKDSRNVIQEIQKIKEEDPEYFEFELTDKSIDIDEEKYMELLDQDNEKRELELLNQEKMLRDFVKRLRKIPYDSKAKKLIDLLKGIYEQNPQEKILIFTQFIDTLFYLKNLLESENEDFFVQEFYGGLNKDQKSKAVKRFRNSEKFSVLLSTEIGGEGRNFQFCRVLINYDLPWNPMKLEQRIGRLDRIGQKSNEIFIYNFFLEGTVETDVVYALIKRINLFEESIGYLEPIIGRVEKDLKDIIFTQDGNQQKQLREFNRKLENRIKKANEIEMQLDDLVIDKKSFQMDGLISSLASCREIELTNDDLFEWIQFFFAIGDHKYGKLNSPEDKKKHNMENGTSHIILHKPLLQNKKFKFSKEEYIGTFDVDLAQKREEIDFFALGHPLINKVLNLCREDEFEGDFTILNVDRDQFPQKFRKRIQDAKELYLFIFKIKFQGYIVENRISSIVLDKNGNKINGLNEVLFDLEKLREIINFQEKIPSHINLKKAHLQQLKQNAKNRIKQRNSTWKTEIKRLNNKIFKKEQEKKKKIYAHKREILKLKRESLKQKKKQKETEKPSKRQLDRIYRITDEDKRQKKLKEIKSIEEDIEVLIKDIKLIKRKLDDLAFEYEDMKNEMKKRNLSEYYTNLTGFAVINIS